MNLQTVSNDRTTRPMNNDECVLMMSDGQPCRRMMFKEENIGTREMDLFPYAGGVKPVCILHSQSDDKRLDAVHTLFKDEVEQIVNGRERRGGQLLESDIADFRGVVFSRFVSFDETKFTKPAIFSECNFQTRVSFANCTFEKDARFNLAHFESNAGFWSAQFNGEADFAATTFKSHALFTSAKFDGKANFEGTQFDWVDFRQAEFKGHARFYDTTFEALADFSSAKFKGPIAIADFTFSKFKTPEDVLFHRVNKDVDNGLRLRSLNCDIEEVSFRDVRWNKSNGRLVLEDELDVLNAPKDEQRDNSRHELVAVIYRQLVKNFEKTRSYDLAEDCFRGEMRMKQKHPDQPKFSRFMVWMYGLMSQYGSSYTRALTWLVAFIVLFGLLLPFAGVRLNAATSANPPAADVFRWPRPTKKTDLLKTAVAGFWASLAVATFQKSPAYEPGTPIAKHLATTEVVLVSSQFALFLLALRRRFKRE
jgi:uncharacterized protein YjbI with pentapeptide repeats